MSQPGAHHQHYPKVSQSRVRISVQKHHSKIRAATPQHMHASTVLIPLLQSALWTCKNKGCSNLLWSSVALVNQGVLWYKELWQVIFFNTLLQYNPFKPSGHLVQAAQLWKHFYGLECLGSLLQNDHHRVQEMVICCIKSVAVRYCDKNNRVISSPINYMKKFWFKRRFSNSSIKNSSISVILVSISSYKL